MHTPSSLSELSCCWTGLLNRGKPPLRARANFLRLPNALKPPRPVAALLLLSSAAAGWTASCGSAALLSPCSEPDSSDEPYAASPNPDMLFARLVIACNNDNADTVVTVRTRAQGSLS